MGMAMSDHQVLQREIDCLRQANCRLRRDLDRKRRAIRSAYDFALAVRARAIPILCQRSGVARGEWSFHRGACQVADGIIQRLGGEV